jgi:hypothetical protein
MGMPAAMHKEWTHEMWEQLPFKDGNRYEVIDGELFVSPAPTWDHQGVLEELYDIVKGYVKQHDIGRVRMSPADIQIDRRNVASQTCSSFRLLTDVRRETGGTLHRFCSSPKFSRHVPPDWTVFESVHSTNVLTFPSTGSWMEMRVWSSDGANRTHVPRFSTRQLSGA